jgi:antitoxin component YwqK of YwqJK toxin-antitoxin module
MKNGEHKKWHDNGQLWVKCRFVNDELDGEYNAWHSNGQQRVQCHFVNGKYNGEYKEWYPDGEVMVHGVYVNDEPLDIDMGSLTDKDRFELTLRYGAKWL